jgi:hypothetical protein
MVAEAKSELSIDPEPIDGHDIIFTRGLEKDFVG